MKLRILGCSGGIGGRSQRTTAMLLDQDILIDAGTGAADLSIAELSMIDHVFLTHSHLDHIASLPLMIDTVADRRNKPLVVYGTEAVLTILRNHIFNWAIWPDFSEIPTPEAPFMRFQSIERGQTIDLGGRQITALPAEHTVPAVGYRLDSGEASLVFSGDTGVCDAFWRVVNRIPNLRHLIIECAFSNREQQLALVSKHLCPNMLATELQKLERECEIHITHLKPGQIELTMEEIETCLGDFKPKMLQNNQLIEF
ncbi:MBL fold metallo-hydrolase [Dechloromonas sp. TW-R-39-2]|jgi:ribonuclease BN (tRNA processing enzyme)|uniref:3',5'-cyclic-nucleotide phosphodiesterase n=1 Tax=Dechloromonas TaxID=73029 RepID=UPI00193C976D|nr:MULTISPECIES: 3',5'-cyclic-nucleotide phosphodiesterase [Dechloromonas]QRM20557.1 MBL fold metallo-hydrolase [Dechloromonas sp. TW-R-39-2]UCV10991.1 3',5'-cyclic-nucleotide phosphodiesterase [Dechloromonas denitrificans]